MAWAGGPYIIRASKVLCSLFDDDFYMDSCGSYSVFDDRLYMDNCCSSRALDL